jgi:hypothetical protein
MQLVVRKSSNVLVLVAALFYASTLAYGAEKKNDQNKANNAVPLNGPKVKLNSQEVKAVRKLERKLATKLNSKENPGDRDTWYVLMFLDQAGLQAEGGSRSGQTLTYTRETQLAQKPKALTVQGKRNAAIEIVRFLVSGNEAAKILRRPGVSTGGMRTQFGGNKVWNWQAFATEKDARTFHQRVLPKKVKKKVK